MSDSPANQVSVRLPDFELEGAPLVVANWYSAAGERIVEGQRLVEVVSPEAAIEISAPASGRLIKQCIAVGQPIRVGQVLAIIDPC
jgi:pyruvate/2-oxoglutarate dehydrogenase complex dihydrolipoamide acyltransferase (E2) component